MRKYPLVMFGIILIFPSSGQASRISMSPESIIPEYAIIDVGGTIIAYSPNASTLTSVIVIHDCNQNDSFILTKIKIEDMEAGLLEDMV